MSQPKAPDLWNMIPSQQHADEDIGRTRHVQRTTDSEGGQMSSTSAESLYSRNKSTEKLYSLSETKTVEKLCRPSEANYQGFDEDGNITFLGPDGKILDLSADAAKSGPQPTYKEGCCPDGWKALSGVYSVIVILVCLALSTGEALSNSWLTKYTTLAFLLYVYGIGVIFLVCLEIALVKVARRGRQLKSPNGSLDRKSSHAVNGTANGGVVSAESYSTLSTMGSLDMYLVTNAAPPQTPAKQRLSLMHRIGIAVFGVGSLVYESLLLKEFHDGRAAVSCGIHSNYWVHYVLLGFITVQTYVVFKHPQVVVHRWKPLVRFGYMHVLAVNVCSWMRALSRQTLEKYIRDQWTAGQFNSRENFTASSPNYSLCVGRDDEPVGVHRAQPYLYPCMLQYGVLAATAMVAFTCSLEPGPSAIRQPAGASEQGRAFPAGFLEVNFHRSHKGLLAGLVVFAAMCVSVVFSFSSFDDRVQSDGDRSLLIFLISDTALQAILILASVWNWIRVCTLSYSPGRCLHVDSAALVVSFFVCFLFLLLRVVPVLGDLATGQTALETIMAACSGLLALLLGFIQSAFVVDAFHREATSRRTKKELPGRGISMFLLITNLAAWVLRTVYVREVSDLDSPLHVAAYTSAVWTLFAHALWPWQLLFHFQAATCMLHIWTTIYRPETVVTRLSQQASRRTATVEKADMGTQVKVIELKHKVKETMHQNGEMQTVLSPVSEV